ncbi:RhoGAP-domain-containing protein, partial [Ascodesmis nigricans]
MTATDAPIVGPSYPSSPPTKASLTSWWERFRKKNSSLEGKDSLGGHGIFGVPLHESIKYANVAINVTDANGESQVYGYVPVVVAKCGVYLKEKATNVEGIFRLSGSAKRIKDLQTVFDTPDTYGKGLDWSGYTVHDAANVLRRYLNQLPEPIVPLEFYTRFRDPLTINPDTFDEAHAIKVYQNLIMQLPDLNRQLLLYILDLLAVFASKSDQNLMTANNLAAIFQPGLISHPSHEMAPSAYKLSQDVLVFLITHQDHFLL